MRTGEIRVRPGPGDHNHISAAGIRVRAFVEIAHMLVQGFDNAFGLAVTFVLVFQGIGVHGIAETDINGMRPGPAHAARHGLEGIPDRDRYHLHAITGQQHTDTLVAEALQFTAG